MGDERKRLRAWIPLAIGIGLLLLSVVMFLVGRKGAASDRRDFYGSIDGIGFLLSPCVAFAGLIWLAILCLRSGRTR
ncbi:MAG TPA: hypothetical protein VMR25_23925 [Planctomycetaceae bacterium]|jgi:hypothetical protein|nr:hypothetical protein [Planctomycetaceae bacterium]